MKYEGVITKSITLLKDIGNLSWGEKGKRYYTTVSELKKNRDKLKEGYEKMKVVMDCINLVGECAPSGISEMIEYNAEAFKAAGKTIKRVYDYAERIEKESGALDAYRKNTSSYKDRVREVLNWREK